MLKYLYPSRFGPVVVVAGLLVVIGGCQTLIDLSEFARGPAPLRMPSPAEGDSLAGGRIFDAYCGYCHNARSLAERPFSNYQNVAQHMRVRANLTGEENAKLMAWLRRWSDVPPPNPPVEPSAKRLIFAQPIPELREQQPSPEATPQLPQPQKQQ